MASTPHILINGLSIGSGGGYTVGRELYRSLAQARPQWRFTMALIGGQPLHESMRAEPDLPGNGQFLWAPAATIGPMARDRYEKRSLARWAAQEGVGAVVQLNGMIVPGMAAPTLAHCQDPWPYRPEARSGLKHWLIAFLKRRRNARAFREAHTVGFTSRYLMELMVGALGIKPRRAEVFYNGLPDEWIQRALGPLPAWEGRPLELISVSNVNAYKRQDLVIRAVAQLVRRAGFESLVYRIVGHAEPAYAATLQSLARELGVERNVVLEGRVADERVRELLARARAFVLMSVCESFGIPAIEAMSFGTPVVTSDCCAMPEVCGDAAILSPTDDLGALVENLQRAVTDAALAQDLRQRGARRAAGFRWSETAAQMMPCLEDMIARKP